MISRSFFMAFAALTVVWTLAGAHGQTIEIGPNGLRVNPPEGMIEERQRPPRPYEVEGITEYEAVRIARREGLERVERVRQGRRGWVIAGVDRDGEDIRIIISRDGAVIDVQRE
jgi:hypothetical protein